MNLAIEYFVRSGLAKEAFEVPCSLLLTNLQNFGKRLVVTIKWHKFSEQYQIQCWKVSSCPVGDLLPDFDEVLLPFDKLFDHELTVVPMYRLLPFTEAPYKAGIRQRGTGQRAAKQEAEYQQAIDEFLNPAIHQRLRLCWLWATFMSTHRLLASEETLYSKIDEHMRLISNRYRTVWHKWVKWREYFLPETIVAPELIFQDSYETKVTNEIGKLPTKIGWNPWQALGVSSSYDSPTNTFLRPFTKGKSARNPLKRHNYNVSLYSHTRVPPKTKTKPRRSKSAIPPAYSNYGNWDTPSCSMTDNYLDFAEESSSSTTSNSESDATTSGGYGTPITVWFS